MKPCGRRPASAFAPSGTPVLRRSCVNSGGAGSSLRLPGVPECDREIVLGDVSATVLRHWQARPGEILTAVDAQGGCWRLRLTGLSPPRGVPFARLPRPVESPLALEVYQALPSRERFELVLQKLTELGVTRIVPVETARSVTRAERDAAQAKSHRWPDVILRAAKQCRRALLPELYLPVPLAAALALAGPAERKLLLYEGEQGLSLAAALAGPRPQQVALLIGPEGGFAAEEVVAARAAGFLTVGLGPRLLRTETAAIAAAALVQGMLGDLT